MKNKTHHKKLNFTYAMAVFVLSCCSVCSTIYAVESEPQYSKLASHIGTAKSAPKARQHQAADKYEIIAYFPAWTSSTFPATSANIDAKKLSMINYAFLDICWDGIHGNNASDHQEEGSSENFLESACQDSQGNPIALPNGAVTLGNSLLDAKNMSDLVVLKNLNPNLKIVPSVGGWVWSNRFSDMAASAATRTNFIVSTVALMREYKLDGIDLDWEYPSAIGLPCAKEKICQRTNDKENFILLAQELRAAFETAGTADGKHYYITIAAGANADYVNNIDGQNKWIAQLAKSLDWINVMTYDYHGPFDKRSGFNAPLFADPRQQKARSANDSIQLYLAAGVPAKKLTLGLPFYGYGWLACDAGKTKGMNQACAGAASASANGNTFTFSYLVKQGYLKKDAAGKYTVAGLGYQRYWHNIAKVPYLYKAAEKTVISYDDEISIHLKDVYIQSKGLRGGMFWELNADREKILGTVISKDLAH